MAQRENNSFKHLNTYSLGMNQDLSPRMYDNKHYFEAEWMTPLNNETGDIGVLTNPKGNVEKIIFAPAPGIGEGKHIIIGEASLRDKRIIVTNKRSLGVNNYNTYIYEFTDDGTNNTQTADASGLGDVTNDPYFNLIWTDDSSINSAITTADDKLGYNNLSKLDIVTRYESSTIQKIYIACEGFPLRYFNIIYNADTNDYTQFTEKDFNIIPSVNLSKCTFSEYTLGGMLAGVVVYAYQLYKVNGSETAFSETSERIIISNTVNSASTLDLYGSDKETVTGVGVKMSIANLDNNFNRIRVIAIHYEDYYIEPSIRIVYEASYDTSSLSFVDTGESLGTYDLAEFRVFNQYFIKPKHLITKNNMLFAGNMEEEYFDLDEYLVSSGQTSILTTDAGGTGKQFWDARAYRFDGQTPRRSQVRIDKDTLEYSLLSTTKLYDSIPYDHNCYNDYNTTTKNGYYYDNPTQQQKYDISGNIGASGKNLTVGMTYTTFNLDNSSEKQTFENTDMSHGEILGRWASWQRDEIYNLAIQFEDYLGRKSYPKWILDLRMRDYLDGAGLISGSQTINLYPTVKITTGKLPLNPDGSKMKWRILKVKRDFSNRTVIGTALASAMLVNTTIPEAIVKYGAYYGSPNIIDAYSYVQRKSYDRKLNYIANNINVDYFQLITPEVFFSDITLDNCYLSHQGYLRSVSANQGVFRSSGTATWTATTSANFPYGHNSIQTLTKYDTFVAATNDYAISDRRLINIDKHKKIKAQPIENYEYSLSNYSLNNIVYTNRNVSPLSGVAQHGENGSCFIVNLKARDGYNYFPITGIGITLSERKAFMVLIKKDGYPYGGGTYEGRLNNSYIPASEFYTLENQDCICFYGDTYISYFDYVRTQYTNKDDKYLSEILYIPTESPYNLRLRNDTGFNKIANLPYDPIWKLTEEGIVDLDKGIEVTSLYRYNTVYSRQNDSESYNAIPFDANNNYEYDTRIRRSEVKSNGEYSDSWLKFLANNYIDVDGQYGELTRLDVFKDKLLFWQPKALGTVPVGEKELIPSGNSSTLALGSSGILNRYDYIDDSAGVSQKNAVLVTPTSIVFFSSYRNTMFRYIGQNQPISDVLGMNSWFDQYVNMNTNIISGYNPLLWECWFTFGNYTLIFNDNHNMFSYFVPTVIPDRYMTHNNVMYMWRNTVSSTGYKHNVGNYGQLFGNYLTSSVTLLINPQGTVMTVFDVLEMLTEKYASNGTTELQETFDTIRIYNDYQDTGTITLTPDDNIVRRLRTWRFNTIRDNSVTSGDPKIRSSFIKVKLTFTNSSANEKILLHNLTTNYRLSKMMG